jgi:hypothetical protein
VLVEYERLKLLGLSTSVPYEPIEKLDGVNGGVNLKGHRKPSKGLSADLSDSRTRPSAL